jgi:hypothetical protein
MRFARWVFGVAGVYGVAALTPFYFMEEEINREKTISHPEFFYGFVGVALAWQVAFLVIALDPIRYRLFMIPAVLEKASFAIAVPILFAFGRAPGVVLAFSLIDGLLGLLFAVAFWLTAGLPRETASEREL